MVAIKAHNRNLWSIDRAGNVFILDSLGNWQPVTIQELFWNIKDSNNGS